jgi:cob(I)alamin adenosyltransferase
MAVAVLLAFLVLAICALNVNLYHLSRTLLLMQDDLHDLRCSISTVGHSAHKLLNADLERLERVKHSEEERLVTRGWT